MKLNKKIFLAAVFGVIISSFSALSVYADADRRAFISGIRPMSMGGAFVAVADDENAFFYNPAGITQRQSWLFQAFSLDIAVNTETFDFGQFFFDNKNDLENFDDLAPQEQAELIRKINKDVIGKVPNVMVSLPDLAYISKPYNISENQLSFGAGFFSYVNANFQFNRSIVPSLSYIGEATAVAAVPVAYKITSLEGIKLPGSLSVGANFKYMYRGKLEDHDLSVAEFETLNKLPMQTGDGFGVDFGLLYFLNARWSFGLQLTDAFYSSMHYNKFENDDYPYRNRDAYTAGIRPEWNIGAAYVPEKIYYWPGKYIDTNRRFTFAADLSDIANDDETLTDSFWKKTHFGAEYKYYPFVVRAGVNSGYPTVGAGIGTNVVQLDYAFYGQEEGRYAGQDPSWFHRILFSVKIGESNGKPYGKDVKKETKSEKEKKVKDSGKQRDVDDVSESEKDDSDDIKPASIPKDAKETINKPAEITELK